MSAEDPRGEADSIAAAVIAVGAIVLAFRLAATASLRAVRAARSLSTRWSRFDEQLGSFAPRGLQRRIDLARLASRRGIDYASHRLRRAVAPAESRADLDAAFEMRTAADVSASLGNMKGVIMKLGQIMSYADDGLPEPLRDALSQLQQDAPPMSADLARETVERELGARPEQIFAEWSARPLAAASIGQVHRAVTRDGRTLAVKVQYPGVAAAINSDLADAGFVFAMLARRYPGMDAEPIVEELRQRLSEELDYELEAANQRWFAEQWAGHPTVSVPAVVPEYSTKRILATDLAKGVRFDEMATWSQEERNAAAVTIFRFVYTSLYHLGAFNGDPHPGNYIFRPGGRVSFLDFGLVKRFTPDEVTVLRDLARTMVVERDVPAFRTVLERAGFLPAGAPFSDELVGQYFGHFFSFLLEQQPATFTPPYASATVRRLFDTSGPYAEIMKAGNAPPFAVILQRINIGLIAILGRLRATADWRSIAEECWNLNASPTSPT